MWLTCAALMAAVQTCYILAVNAGILSDSGGNCSDADCTVRARMLVHMARCTAAATAHGTMLRL
jgi:hypothetical protein